MHIFVMLPMHGLDGARSGGISGARAGAALHCAHAGLSVRDARRGTTRMAGGRAGRAARGEMGATAGNAAA